jgi:hypothetical protein
VLDQNDSTTALLAKFRSHSASLASKRDGLRKVNWLIASRNHTHLRQYLSSTTISVIDLDNEREYGSRVKDARVKHAKLAVSQLKASKNWGLGLAYTVGNSIEVQSEDDTWVNVLCIFLAAMPDDSNGLTIRKWLDEAGKHKLHELIEHEWKRVCDHARDIES